MPVYHFTLHAYGTWMPDKPKGYVHHTRGLLPSDPDLADAQRSSMKFPVMCFDRDIQVVLIRTTHAECKNNDWRVHAIGSDPTHFHTLLSWKQFEPCNAVMKQWKNVLSFTLGRDIGPRGRRWFVRGGSQRRVTDRGYFDHLVHTYFPSHPGVYWREGEPLP